jgi:hypothetical protein
MEFPNHGLIRGRQNERRHLDTDPGEMHNLVTKPEFADELRRHRRLLKEWQTATNDTLLRVE